MPYHFKAVEHDDMIQWLAYQQVFLCQMLPDSDVQFHFGVCEQIFIGETVFFSSDFTKYFQKLKKCKSNGYEEAEKNIIVFGITSK
jgi:hypothetical protein